MKTDFKTPFLRQVKNITNARIQEHIARAVESVEEASQKKDIPQLKKLTGYKDCYRIRVGNYRIGVTFDGDVVIFHACLPRKDFYKYFP
jgi:mRNA interferase RelE/StbE